jgi:hypothetical protein
MKLKWSDDVHKKDNEAASEGKVYCPGLGKKQKQPKRDVLISLF